MTIMSFEGQAPELARDCGYVAASAELIGRVRIESGASVWFGAVLRGDNEWIAIGPGSNVQDNCVFHTDMGYPLTVGENCTIGHLACLHGCTIGDGSLIGMGATVLNGARIGKGCLIGAKALVSEGMEVPDGSLVLGVPGRVARVLDADARARLLDSARGYREKSERYIQSCVTTG
ncbi:gamma carbonic anhydrase family protein [Pelagibacterium lacus]|uniref:Gamma carbonic anhydrase family protein n=1 Tax=Pelagibacterium lacus TaxID=2282655 RepID=A0A369W4P9_9HYPH|nr:gamma carbonic anhydrase family protein [Pelagibacterium lacus]RDE08320.1 gamma carbonic anhydrase family protein [Pelagibacterium lacus]